MLLLALMLTVMMVGTLLSMRLRMLVPMVMLTMMTMVDVMRIMMWMNRVMMVMMRVIGQVMGRNVDKVMHRMMNGMMHGVVAVLNMRMIGIGMRRIDGVSGRAWISGGLGVRRRECSRSCCCGHARLREDRHVIASYDWRLCGRKRHGGDDGRRLLHRKLRTSPDR